MSGRGPRSTVPRALRTLEATFFDSDTVCAETDKCLAAGGWARTVAVSAWLGPRQRTVLCLELDLHPPEHLERAIERGDVMCGHHARA